MFLLPVTLVLFLPPTRSPNDPAGLVDASSRKAGNRRPSTGPLCSLVGVTAATAAAAGLRGCGVRLSWAEGLVG